jgi:hypothetical protein
MADPNIGPSTPDPSNGIMAANGLPASYNSQVGLSGIDGGNYWDGDSGTNENLTNTVPGGQDNRDKFALTYALSDPTSDISQMLQYGGSSNYAAQAEQADQALGNNAMTRVGAQLNTSNISQDTGMQNNLSNQLYAVANGSTNTPAQQQLAQSYGQNAQALRGAVTNTMGGAADAAAARSTANQAITSANLQQNQQSQLLSANEATAARQNLGSVTNSMFNTAQGVALNNANLQQQQNNLNANFQANQQKRALTTAGNALSANEQYQNDRLNAVANAYGFQNSANQMYNEAAQNTTRGILGGIQGGITAAAGIANNSGSGSPSAASTATSGLTGAVTGAVNNS